MKIYIHENNKKIFIPIPLALLKTAFTIAQTPLIMKHMPQKEKEYMSCIDFKLLRECVDMLKNYKGLVLVDVTDSKGNHIKIVI